MLRPFNAAPTRESAGRDFVNPEVLEAIARLCESAHEGDRSHLEEQFSLALHNLKMANVYKRTNARRLPMTETAILALISPPLQPKCRILDVGSSDGITTVELLEHLRSRWGAGVTAVMADINLWLERYKLGPLIEYREPGGSQVLVRLRDRGFRVMKHSSDKDETQIRLRRTRAIARDLYWRLWDLARPLMRYDGRVGLINPRATSFTGLEARVLNCLMRDDSLLDAFDCIRASNILNLSYFSRDQLSTAVANLHAYLREGGGLVISRNEGTATDETEHGTSWVKSENGFEAQEDFGRGSEIRDLVDAFRVKSS